MLLENEVIKNLVGFSKWYCGQKTLTGNVERLVNNDVICRAVRIMAHSSNSNYVYIGGEGLTADNSAIVLEAGDAINLTISNLKNIFVLGENGEKINYVYMV